MKTTIKAAALIALGIASGNAQAYLDPGTGSLLIQGLLAAIAGTVTVAKLYWHRIMAFLGRRPPEAADDSPDAGEKPGQD